MGISRLSRFNAGSIALGSQRNIYGMLGGRRSPKIGGNGTIDDPDETDGGGPWTVITLT